MSKQILVRLLYGDHHVVGKDGVVTTYYTGDTFHVAPEELWGLSTQLKKVEVVDETPVSKEELSAARQISVTKLNVSNVIKGKLKSAGLHTANAVVEAGLPGLVSISGIGQKTAEEILADARAAIGV